MISRFCGYVSIHGDKHPKYEMASPRNEERPFPLTLPSPPSSGEKDGMRGSESRYSCPVSEFLHQKEDDLPVFDWALTPDNSFRQPVQIRRFIWRKDL